MVGEVAPPALARIEPALASLARIEPALPFMIRHVFHCEWVDGFCC
jgi:hypothetical protein